MIPVCANISNIPIYLYVIYFLDCGHWKVPQPRSLWLFSHIPAMCMRYASPILITREPNKCSQAHMTVLSECGPFLTILARCNMNYIVRRNFISSVMVLILFSVDLGTPWSPWANKLFGVFRQRNSLCW